MRDTSVAHIFLKQYGNYFTASLSAFAARNFGTRIALICTASPVRGLRPTRAGRTFAEKIPSPAIETRRLPSVNL